MGGLSSGTWPGVHEVNLLGVGQTHQKWLMVLSIVKSPLVEVL